MRGLEPPRAQGPQAPEACAYTNFATSAGPVERSEWRRFVRPAATGWAGGRLLPCRAVSPPSSRGLGRRPLTAETGVRIPVAVLSGARWIRGAERQGHGLGEGVG